MEILQITSAIVGIKNAIDIAKAIKDSGASLEKAEINFKIAELINALADAKIGIATIQEAMAEKDSEIKRLKTELETRGNMIWEPPYYFLKNGSSTVLVETGAYRLMNETFSESLINNHLI
jgi:hypothetical protein